MRPSWPGFGCARGDKAIISHSCTLPPSLPALPLLLALRLSPLPLPVLLPVTLLLPVRPLRLLLPRHLPLPHDICYANPCHTFKYYVLRLGVRSMARLFTAARTTTTSFGSESGGESSPSLRSSHHDPDHDVLLPSPGRCQCTHYSGFERETPKSVHVSRLYERISVALVQQSNAQAILDFDVPKLMCQRQLSMMQ